MDTKDSSSHIPGHKHQFNNNDGASITISQIIYVLKRYWYFFLISVPLALLSVNIYHRYVVPVYSASATIIYKSQNENRLSSTTLMDGFGLSPEAKNLENQMFMLRSYSVIKRTIDKLDFNIEYIAKGRFKDTELYNQSAFYLEIDSAVPQLLDTPIDIKLLDEGNLLVSAKVEGGTLFNYVSNSVEGNCAAFTVEKLVKWDELISTPGFAFRIRKREKRALSINQPHCIVFRNPEAIAYQYRGGLAISPYNESSSILFLSAVGSNGDKLKAFLNQLSRDLIELNLEQKNEIANRTISFINKQLAVISDTLESVQSELIQFKRENGLFEPTNAITKLADTFSDAEKEMKMIEVRLEYLAIIKQKLIDDPKGSDFLLPAFSDETFPVITELIMKQFALNNELKEAMGNANISNPYVNSLQQKVDVAYQNLLLAIDKASESMKMKSIEMAKNLKGYDVMLGELPDIERRYLKLDRKYKLNEAIYTFLLQKNSETQITKASNAPDNEVLDSATVSGMVSPNTQRNYSRAFLFGLIIPIGLIFLLEYFNVRVRLKEDIQHILPQIPMLGIIPFSKNKEELSFGTQIRSNISESFRTLRTRLNFLTMVKGHRVITVSSTDAGEGKTFVSVNLAMAYAASGKNTVLIGLDLRKPRLPDVLNIQQQHGVSNYLIGQSKLDEILIKSHLPNFTIVTSGDIPPNPSELISSDGMVELLNYLRQTFDVVVIDTPPIGLVSDARWLMEDSDAVLYVVRCNKTHKTHLRHTIHNLLNEGVKNIGVILNGVENKPKGYGNYSSEYYL